MASWSCLVEAVWQNNHRHGFLPVDRQLEIWWRMKKYSRIALTLGLISLMRTNIQLNARSKSGDLGSITDRRMNPTNPEVRFSTKAWEPEFATEFPFRSANSADLDVENSNETDSKDRNGAFNYRLTEPTLLPDPGSQTKHIASPSDSADDKEHKQSAPESGSRVIDVKEYGARGDGRANDTASIQRAINAACRGLGGEIYFPPGFYLIQQNQLPTPATVPDLNVPVNCSGLHFNGGNISNRRSWPQFAQAPQVLIQVVAGPNPNGSPVFLLQQGGEPGATQGGQQSKFENLAINGYNEAVWVLSAVNERFKNCALSRPNNRTARQRGPQGYRYLLVLLHGRITANKFGSRSRGAIHRRELFF